MEVRISAWTGTFGGTSEVYVGLGQLGESATKLQGFPRSLSDTRELEFGAFGRESAGGGVLMRFYCADKSGHTYVETKMESGYEFEGKVQSVVLYMPIEPAAVDSFVAELRVLESKGSGTARLRGILKE